MAYTMKTDGMEELSRMLSKLGNAAQGVAAASLYEGAGVMADAVSQAVQGIATKRLKYPAPPGKQRMPSPEEKALLLQAKMGVAKFRKDGISVQTSVGMQNSGYGTINGKQVPIPAVANAINSGTSFMKKQPFFRKAVRQKQRAAEAAIESGIRKRVEEITKE